MVTCVAALIGRKLQAMRRLLGPPRTDTMAQYNIAPAFPLNHRGSRRFLLGPRTEYTA